MKGQPLFHSRSFSHSPSATLVYDLYVPTRSFTFRFYVQSIIEFLGEPRGRLPSRSRGRMGSFVRLHRVSLLPRRRCSWMSIVETAGNNDRPSMSLRIGPVEDNPGHDVSPMNYRPSVFLSCPFIACFVILFLGHRTKYLWDIYEIINVYKVFCLSSFR